MFGQAHLGNGPSANSGKMGRPTRHQLVNGRQLPMAGGLLTAVARCSVLAASCFRNAEVKCHSCCFFPEMFMREVLSVLVLKKNFPVPQVHLFF